MGSNIPAARCRAASPFKRISAVITGPSNQGQTVLRVVHTEFLLEG